MYVAGTNYVEKLAPPCPFDLFIQFLKGKRPLENITSILCWGEDNHVGLDKEFRGGFDHIFVRDHHFGEPGFPINFGAETRYYCATEHGLKPLKDRSIDICFLGQLGYADRAKYVAQLKKDFSQYNLVLGERLFNTPDDHWSKWTLPWSAHDPAYFATLANSKVVLSFRGAGPDCGRHWECLASGAVPVIESMGLVDLVKPTPEGVKWFFGYEQLHRAITEVLGNLDKYQEAQERAWAWNREHHSTKARVRYLLDMIGMG